MALDYYVNPFELEQLATKLDPQATIADAIAAVNADIAAKLLNPCPRCLTAGRIASDADACSVCYGKGYTLEQVSSPPRTFTPIATVPEVTP